MMALVHERRLPGGNAGGAVLVDGTVRRTSGLWTPAIHELLRHLEVVGFDGAPRAIGFDEAGREVLSFLPGATVGESKPWPPWVHSTAALTDVGDWLRRYHAAVADFLPSPGARWRMPGRSWQPGDVVGHNDAAPYNAVWRRDDRGLVGFIDWDFAAPCAPLFDLAFVVFSWVPLHARDVVAAEGFTDFASRPRRLRLLLDAYGYSGSVDDVLSAVRVRIAEHIEGIQALADGGDPLFKRLVDSGSVDGLARALVELDQDSTMYRGS